MSDVVAAPSVHFCILSTHAFFSTAPSGLSVSTLIRIIIRKVEDDVEAIRRNYLVRRRSDDWSDNILTAIKETFRNGRVELDKDPGIVGESAVVVTFLKSEAPSATGQQSNMITFGMLAEPGRGMSDEDDFKIAEYGEFESPPVRR
jgi:hypothetical protein